VAVPAHQKGVLTLKRMLLNRKMRVIARSYVFRDAFVVSPLMTFLLSSFYIVFCDHNVICTY
jgi:hypothetical protein